MDKNLLIVSLVNYINGKLKLWKGTKMNKVLLQTIIVVMFCGAALAVEPNVTWVPGDDLLDFERFPQIPTTNDVINFTIPTDVFDNHWQAEQSLGGTPSLIIDDVQKTIDLQFVPPAPEDPIPTEYDPVSGLQGSFGPLEEGSWLFFAQFPGTIYIDPFDVVFAPPSAAQDFLTERFTGDGDAFDLTDKSVFFIPTPDGTSYTAEIQQISKLPTDPTGGTNLGLGDDTFSFIKLSGSATVSIYDVSFTGFYVGSNGYITFTEGDQEYSDTLSNHFDLSRISGLFCDLNPSAGGQVSWKQLNDSAVVTWENVPEYGTNNSNTFQIALFYDGSIRISWLGIDAAQCIVGLSEGLGVPQDFQEIDFSKLPQTSPPSASKHLVEQFTSDGDDFDLSFRSIIFTPDGAGTSYSGQVQEISKLPTDPIGGTNLVLGDDNFAFVKLSSPIEVFIYGNSFTGFYVGSNGYITFTEGDQEYSESLENHFNMLRVSALFRDLNPSAGGQVSWKYMIDRVAVTWQNVPEYGQSGSNTFQVELFYNGNIRLSWLAIAVERGIVGLSDGLGVPDDFQETDLSKLSTSPPPPPPPPPSEADYLTEQFLNNEVFDLEFSSVTFTPASDGISYVGSLQDITQLPTSPFGGQSLGLRDDNFVRVVLSSQARVKIFDQSFRSFFVGINGYITFTRGDTDFSQTLDEHFELLRIAGLYCDLTARNEGTVTAKQLADRVAVTWQEVPEFSNTSPNTFQIEMFYDGRIRISWLEIGSRANIVGLSNGLGQSPNFKETDFSVRYAPPQP
jgi:hypothetical protein